MREDWQPELMRSVVCKKCGKKFLPAVYHVYKDAGKYYCSWHCYNHKDDGKKKRTRSGVLMYDKDGVFLREFASSNEASMYLHGEGKAISSKSIQLVCRGEQGSAGGYIFKYKEKKNDGGTKNV